MADELFAAHWADEPDQLLWLACSNLWIVIEKVVPAFYARLAHFLSAISPLGIDVETIQRKNLSAGDASLDIRVAEFS